MYNWSVDTKRLEKDKKAYTKWRLEQLINYGLKEEKLDKTLLKKYLEGLSIDNRKKNYLRILL